jgi:YVTN family beta-propeller protein
VRCSNVRQLGREPITSNNRAVGLRLLLSALALVVLLASLASAQPVPDTILLPDSLGPLHWPFHLASGGSSGDIYVASESSDIIVVDGNTFQRMKRINTGTPVGGVCLVALHDKLYCSYPKQGRIGVTDCATNNVVGSIQVGAGPRMLCYSAGSDKLYCGDSTDGTVSVIDCTADTVVATIAVGESLAAMAYDPGTNKVYVAMADAVLAIGCQADSVVARMTDVKATTGLLVNQRRQKLYAVGPRYVRPETVSVVSTRTDSVIAKMTAPGGPLLGLASNEATDRLYGALYLGSNGWYIVEFDCAGDTFTRMNGVDGEEAIGLACDTARNRLYYYHWASNRGLLYLFDCVTMEILSGTQVEDYPIALELDPVRRRVLCAGGLREGVLSVFPCESDTLDEVGVIPLHGSHWSFTRRVMCHNPTAGKLYYLWGDAAGGVGVIDEQTNRVVAQVVLPQDYGGADIVHDRLNNKVYCGCAPGLAILDGTSDSLVKLVDFGDGASRICWNPDLNKLYCYVSEYPRRFIAVLDCWTDSVVREIDVQYIIDEFEYLGQNRLLCLSQNKALNLIDCRTDSVVIDTPFDGNIYAVEHTGDGKKAYVIHHYTYDRLEALSTDSLSLLATVDWPYSRGASLMFLMLSDSISKLYWFAGDSILAVDVRGDTVTTRMGAITPHRFGCFGRSGRYLYCSGFDEDKLVVYDTRSDSTAAVEETPPQPDVVVPNPELGCVYVKCVEAILAYTDFTPAVAEGPISLTQNRSQTVLRTSDLSVMRTGLWFDVAGRRVKTRMTDGGGRVLRPGVYLTPGDGRTPTKIVVVR